jgi:ABC-type nitrate/sulfonate/bicarbonate transport system substrate-binding protein
VHAIELPYSVMPAAIGDGRVDAATLLMPILQQALDSGNVRALAHMYDAIGNAFPQSAWFATTDYIKANVDAVRRFARVVHDASAYADGHHAETALVVAPIFGQTIDTIKRSTRSSFVETFDSVGLQSLIATLAKYKVIDRVFPAAELMSPTVADIWSGNR